MLLRRDRPTYGKLLEPLLHLRAYRVVLLVCNLGKLCVDLRQGLKHARTGLHSVG